jgi:hypothetical protein
MQRLRGHPESQTWRYTQLYHHRLLVLGFNAHDHPPLQLFSSCMAGVELPPPTFLEAGGKSEVPPGQCFCPSVP